MEVAVFCLQQIRFAQIWTDDIDEDSSEESSEEASEDIKGNEIQLQK